MTVRLSVVAVVAVQAALATVAVPPATRVAVPPEAKPVKDAPVTSKVTAETVFLAVARVTAEALVMRTASKSDTLAPLTESMALLTIRVSVPPPPDTV